MSLNVQSRSFLSYGTLFTGLVLGVLTLRLHLIKNALGNSQTYLSTNLVHQADFLLDGFPIYAQAYDNSCGATTISMIYSYLVEPITEEELATDLGVELGQSGMLPYDFADILRLALEENGYSVDHQVNVPDARFLEIIHDQVNQGVPVPIYYSTINDWDKPNFDTHYSAVIGIQPQNRKVIIANAYGFLEELSYTDLLDAVKFGNYRNPPWDFRIGLFSGMVNKNNLFAIRK